jgi:hypothetical protein
MSNSADYEALLAAQVKIKPNTFCRSKHERAYEERYEGVLGHGEDDRHQKSDGRDCVDGKAHWPKGEWVRAQLTEGDPFGTCLAL